MGGCQFEQVIVIGYGVVTGEILRTVHEKAVEKGYTDTYIEHEVHPFNSAKRYAEAEQIEYHVMEDSAELLDFFQKAAVRKTLIISASNNYLFPAGLIGNSNVTIINFHNALLPELPGRNAPSWAIYEGRGYTGITWHYVTSGVDAGDIIIQKECRIDGDTRAYELTARLMQLAAEAFDECYEAVLCGETMARRQDITGKRRLYKSYEVPSDGRFDLSSPVEDIYRLLRAMDYGKNDIFPMPVTRIGDDAARIRRYKKVGPEEVKQGQPYSIYLPLGDGNYLMLRYDIIKADGTVGGGIDDAEYLYLLISELKTVKRHLVSNMLLPEDALKQLIAAGKLRYEYVRGKYLNLWHEEWDFARLFFYITELDDYRVAKPAKPLVCDLIFQKADEKGEALLHTLRRQGFVTYAGYHKWLREGDGNKGRWKGSFRILRQRTEGFYDLLCRCFDRYSDYVPEKDRFEEYLEGKICYSAVDKGSGRTVGGMVVSSKGHAHMEDFVFVDPEMRGKGIASELHDHWYSEMDHGSCKFAAWIRDGNLASEKLHAKYRYEKQSSYKITLKKEM